MPSNDAGAGDRTSPATPNTPNTTSDGQARGSTPAYRKPVFRRYDQIEQVKPYGPSEMEAG
jgi:hypothetical protein